MKKECFLLDVFTSIPYTGNQLAVFPSADDLSSEQMQKIANEINYSETTFILKSTDTGADYDIRIFTPYKELPFAGHPTLGTAYAILNMLEKDKTRKNIKLKTKVGLIPLKKSGNVFWMEQNDPEFFNIYKNKSEIADLVGLNPDDIHSDLPVEEVSTGNTILIVPVKGLTSIKGAIGNMNKIADFFKTKKSMAPYLFTLETEATHSKVHTRFFAPHLGIIEDPATGSAAGPLAGYLLKYNVFGNRFEVQNEQGIEIRRPSQILMRGSIVDGKYKIEIGGTCYFLGYSTFNL